ncbi:MAG: DUF881 domain-containing protein [Peptococcaceae bacterium]|nr:DUF881 domain-containing protein [Peptococcaceae bacterium]
MKHKIHGWHIYLVVTFVLLGILISTQIQTQSRLMSDLSMQSTSDLSIMLKNLTDKRWLLTEELEEAEQNLLTYQNDYSNDTALISSVENELNRLQMISGTSAVKGPGISITVDGYMLATDLVVVINELWAAGAEAITINDCRITATSGISYVDTMEKTYLTCDGTVIQEPYEIRALGNSSILEKSLTMPGGIADSLSLYQVYLNIELQDELTLASQPSQLRLRYGRVPEKN